MKRSLIDRSETKKFCDIIASCEKYFRLYYAIHMEYKFGHQNRHKRRRFTQFKHTSYTKIQYSAEHDLRRIQEGGKKAIPSFLNFLGNAPAPSKIKKKIRKKDGTMRLKLAIMSLVSKGHLYNLRERGNNSSLDFVGVKLFWCVSYY